MAVQSYSAAILAPLILLVPLSAVQAQNGTNLFVEQLVEARTSTDSPDFPAFSMPYSIRDEVGNALLAEDFTSQFDSNSTYSYLQLAQANTGASNQDEATVSALPADASLMTDQCLAFAADPDADLGDVLRAGCQPTLPQMSALMDNPLGNVAMLFNQYDSYLMRNDANGVEAVQGNLMGILQFPKGVSENWNLINRVIFNVASAPLDQDKFDDLGSMSVPGTPPGSINPGFGSPNLIGLASGRTTGFGDMYYVGLFAKKEATTLANGAKFVWGPGFSIGAPTASEDLLGTGKWSAGPSFISVYMGKVFKGGGLITNYFDFAGDDDRDDVRMTNLQYFHYWSLSDTVSIGAAPNIIMNWEASGSDRFTVPVGFGINKTIQFGKVPIRFGMEVNYSVHRPDHIPGTRWDLRFYMIPAVPSALFSWMQ